MGKPAARVGDNHVCPMVTGTVLHVGGPILPPGCPTVLIGGMPAARVGDMATCAGPPDTIAMGSIGVFIGGMQSARIGDTTVHGGSIVVGQPTVLVGGVATSPLGMLNQLTTPQMSEVPTPTKAYLALGLAKSPVSLSDKANLRKLYRAVTEDDYQPESDKVKQKKLARALADDPEIKKAKKDWKKLSEADRKKALQRAADLQADEYGLPKKKLVFKDLGDMSSFGYYSPSKNEVVISDHKNPTGNAILDDSSEAFDTVVHENTHRYQNELVSELDGGKLAPTDDRYYQAQLMKANDSYYAPPSADYTAYRNQPMEAHAWDVGASAR